LSNRRTAASASLSVLLPGERLVREMRFDACHGRNRRHQPLQVHSGRRVFLLDLANSELLRERR
jgi:hypothetical protein